MNSTETPSTEQIEFALAAIDEMDQLTMCRYWRFAPPGTEIYFRNDLPTGAAFVKRLFGHFGGFTAEISKQLGH